MESAALIRMPLPRPSSGYAFINFLDSANMTRFQERFEVLKESKRSMRGP